MVGFKRVKINEEIEKYIVFSLTPEKKLLTMVKELKDVFPKSKKWKDLEAEEVKLELMDKFKRRGKFYRDACKLWLNNNQDLCVLFDEFVKKYQHQEVSAKDVIKFVDDLRKEHHYNTYDVALLMHIYAEQVVGMQLFEESALKIDEEIDKFTSKHGDKFKGFSSVDKKHLV